MIEKWMPIFAYQGRYEISNMGEIKSITSGGKILKTAINTRGYSSIGFYHNGKTKTHRIHKLVAEAFIGPCIPGFCVNHLNGIRTDNRVENLEYVSMRENKCHGVIGKLGRVGAYKYKGKWASAIKINRKREFLGAFNCQEDASRAYAAKCAELSIENKYSQGYLTQPLCKENAENLTGRRA